MVKGCQRRVIQLRDTGSRYFDSVYFILKSDLPPGLHESDMLRAAKSIVDGEVPEEPPRAEKKPRRYDALIAYLSGAATVGLVMGAIALAVHFLL